MIAKELQPRMWFYVGGICKSEGIFIHAIGGMEDHIHLALQIPPMWALGKAVMTIKANSSRWATEQGREFAWQQGYGAFSVSASNLAAVRYIQNQGSYHKKMSFQQEFIALLKKHRVPSIPGTFLGNWQEAHSDSLQADDKAPEAHKKLAQPVRVGNKYSKDVGTPERRGGRLLSGI